MFANTLNVATEAGSLLWRYDIIFQYLQTLQIYLAALPSSSFGGTTAKCYHFRGTWLHLDLLGAVARALKSGTRGRIVKKLTKKQGQ